MARCECSPTCRFTAADGEPYVLAHDPRPEQQAARSALFSERGKRGRAKVEARRAARNRKNCSLRDVSALIGELEGALLLVEQSSGDKVQRANAITKIVMAAHDILARDTERSADRLAKLLADNPTLARRLEAVK